MGQIRLFFERHGLYWNHSFQRLELSRGWAFFAGFCVLIMGILYISSFIG